MNLTNETCVEFLVTENLKYRELLKEWKESDSNVDLRNRTLSLKNFTRESVSGNTINYKLEFENTEDIS